jgi:hypothetical protein
MSFLAIRDLAPIYTSAIGDIKKEATLRSRCRHRPTIAVTSIQIFFFAASIMSLGTEKNIMKARTNDKVKSKSHEVKANKKLRKVMNDPTLEGKDENKVGRFQGKSGSVVKAFQK